tara:strand:- start:4654 stop:5382 length:729 start_codon:yes stop_codon:yes gene_type:complete
MAIFTYSAPVVGGSENTWGATLNTNWSNLSTFLGSLDSAELAVLDGITASTAELNLLDGITATTVELNLLDGVTASTAELNLLDGVTATTAEINYVSGVTSAIQTQLDAKAADTTQATATWEAGTGTTQSLVSPANVKAAVLALTPPNVIGTGSQSWRADTTRAANTWYHNNSQAAIMIQAYWSGGATVYVGPSTSSFATILQNDRDGDLDNPSYVIVPAYHYWKVSHVDHVSSSQYQNILD